MRNTNNEFDIKFRKRKGFLIGFLYGIVLAVIGTLVIGSGAVMFAGGQLYLSEWVWFFGVSFFPTSIVFSLIGLRIATSSLTRRQLIIYALLAAFVIVSLAGSLGAITLGAIRFGIQHVNIEGYLTWAPLYALLLMPITFPLGVVAINILSNLLNKDL